jgi:hypothetical protein
MCVNSSSPQGGTPTPWPRHLGGQVERGWGQKEVGGVVFTFHAGSWNILWTSGR